MLVIGSVAVLSVLSILSYNVISDFTIGGSNFNDTLDYFSNQILLPVGGLLIAIFAGWAVKKSVSRDELSGASSTIYEIWHFLIRFVVPLALVVIIVNGIAE